MITMRVPGVAAAVAAAPAPGLDLQRQAAVMTMCTSSWMLWCLEMWRPPLQCHHAAAPAIASTGHSTLTWPLERQGTAEPGAAQQARWRAQQQHHHHHMGRINSNSKAALVAACQLPR